MGMLDLSVGQNPRAVGSQEHRTLSWTLPAGNGTHDNRACISIALFTFGLTESVIDQSSTISHCLQQVFIVQEWCHKSVRDYLAQPFYAREVRYPQSDVCCTSSVQWVYKW